MIAHDPAVTAALRELGALIVDGDDCATGWLLAVDWRAGRFDDLDGYTRTAIRGLALALAGEDRELAGRAARWIADPGTAMDVGVAEARLRAELAVLGWASGRARVERLESDWRATVTRGSEAWSCRGKTPESAADALLAFLPARRVA